MIAVIIVIMILMIIGIMIMMILMIAHNHDYANENNCDYYGDCDINNHNDHDTDKL